MLLRIKLIQNDLVVKERSQDKDARQQQRREVAETNEVDVGALYENDCKF